MLFVASASEMRVGGSAPPFDNGAPDAVDIDFLRRGDIEWPPAAHAQAISMP
jgi:hypothetical protein